SRRKAKVMNFTTWIRGMAPRNRGQRARAARGQRSRLSRWFSPRLELLEARITPSLLGTFELDGNATTGVLGASGSTTTSHDSDQVFAGTSGALANAFITDKVRSNTDDIFTGGASKDPQGIPKR